MQVLFQLRGTRAIRLVDPTKRNALKNLVDELKKEPESVRKKGANPFLPTLRNINDI